MADQQIKLKKSEEDKDLGITIDSRLTFEQHIISKVNKANSLLGLISRTFEYKNPKTMVTLYKSIVRPHLEFANQIWAPYLVKHVTLIENVQKRATKIIPGLQNLDYKSRLQALNIPTLAYRRLRGDMVEMYKITSNIYDEEITKDLLVYNNTATRGHVNKLFKSRPRLELRKNSFFFRCVDPWNKLPSNIVQAPNLNKFKNHLDKFWKNMELKYDLRGSKAHAQAYQNVITEELASEA